ncbi:MAG: hypothetical protein WCI03_13505 [bacterium]
MTLPTDQTTARTRVTRLSHDSAGLLCCPSIYSTVSAILAGTSTEPNTSNYPVIVLWAGAGQAMLNTIMASDLPPVAPPTVSEIQPPSRPEPAFVTEPTPAPMPEPVPVPEPIATPEPEVMESSIQEESALEPELRSTPES